MLKSQFAQFELDMIPAEFSTRKQKRSQQKAAEEDSNCSYMSETQMKRSQASGCRPVDPRAGMGVNMFCCPKE
jgi:hypothetical protein